MFPSWDAVLFTRRNDIHRHEKRVDVLSSDQPGGLMTVLMGQNMMRKDGEAHMQERRALFPTFSPAHRHRSLEAEFRGSRDTHP